MIIKPRHLMKKLADTPLPPPLLSPSPLLPPPSSLPPLLLPPPPSLPPPHLTPTSLSRSHHLFIIHPSMPSDRSPPRVKKAMMLLARSVPFLPPSPVLVSQMTRKNPAPRLASDEGVVSPPPSRVLLSQMTRTNPCTSSCK
ncbi:hypothetical protein BDQ17DRAFT_1436931 [Cyathus striatus]|nr:hypothetical protein BDQ17DRAFT_1436931 [Cyathus striatus]